MVGCGCDYGYGERATGRGLGAYDGGMAELHPILLHLYRVALVAAPSEEAAGRCVAWVRGQIGEPGRASETLVRRLLFEACAAAHDGGEEGAMEGVPGAVAGMSMRERFVFALARLEGLTVVRVAAAIGVDVGVAREIMGAVDGATSGVDAEAVEATVRGAPTGSLEEMLVSAGAKSRGASRRRSIVAAGVFVVAAVILGYAALDLLDREDNEMDAAVYGPMSNPAPEGGPGGVGGVGGGAGDGGG